MNLENTEDLEQLWAPTIDESADFEPPKNNKVKFVFGKRQRSEEVKLSKRVQATKSNEKYQEYLEYKENVKNYQDEMKTYRESMRESVKKYLEKEQIKKPLKSNIESEESKDIWNVIIEAICKIIFILIRRKQ